jgi:hypothetical protein
VNIRRAPSLPAFGVSGHGSADPSHNLAHRVDQLLLRRAPLREFGEPRRRAEGIRAPGVQALELASRT